MCFRYIFSSSLWSLYWWQLLEDLDGKHTQESDMQNELDNLKDNLTFEKQNLEMAAYDCDKFRSLCDEKDAELKVFVKCNSI